MKSQKLVNVGYVRCAERNQNSIDAQKQTIITQASQHNITIHRWYVDNGISGHCFNRPGLNRLKADIHKDIDSILMTDISRLGRSIPQVDDLLDEFKQAGVKVFTLPLDQKLDFMDMLSSLIFSEELKKEICSKLKKILR